MAWTTLQFAPGEGGGASGVGGPESGAPLAMVIEDDPDAAEVATGMLQMLGFRVQVCPDAHQALYALSANAPDLILLDICLPEMDGVSLLKVARRVKEARDVPVIAASAIYPKGGPIQRALMELGVTEYLNKPFTMAGLKASLHAVMPRHRVRPKAAVPLSMDGSLGGVAKVSGKDLTVEVVGGGEYHLILTTTSSPMPEGQSITLHLKRRELVDDEVKDTEILVLAHVKETGQDGGGWRSRLDVVAARPQDAWDRLARALSGS
jgi:two-component system, cell cycle response regulator DivK